MQQSTEIIRIEQTKKSILKEQIRAIVKEFLFNLTIIARPYALHSLQRSFADVFRCKKDLGHRETTLVFHFHCPSVDRERLAVSAILYYITSGISALNSGRSSEAVEYFNLALNRLVSKNEYLVEALVLMSLGRAYYSMNDLIKAERTIENALQKINFVTQAVKYNNQLSEEIESVIFSLKNKHAMIELQKGNHEDALKKLKNLYEKLLAQERSKFQADERSHDTYAKSRDNSDVSRVENQAEGCSLLNKHSKIKLDVIVSVVMNYSKACLLTGNLENIVEALQNVLHGCQFSDDEHPLQLMISVRLALILTLQGKIKQADQIIDLQEVDCLQIQKLIESDSFKSFSFKYTKDICRILAYRGQRSLSREILQTAIQLCQGTDSNQHPLKKCLEKTMEELFPIIVIEKALLAPDYGAEPHTISRLNVVVNVCFEYALQVVKDGCDRENLLREVEVMNGISSDEKAFADSYASEKQAAESAALSPEVVFISTLHICAFLSQHMESNKKAEVYLENQLRKITSLYDVVNETPISKTGLSFLSDHQSCALSSLCSLLETALLQQSQTSVHNISKSLASFLSLRTKEDANRTEWYKEYCGLLSYFVTTEQIQVSGNKTELYVVVNCGSGLNSSEEVGVPLENKALFSRVISNAESEECSTSYEETRSKCFVHLKSPDLVDINELRQISQSIAESWKSLSVNANYRRNVFVEVLQKIDSAKLSEFCLELRSLNTSLVNSVEVFPSPVRALTVRQLRRLVTFEKSDVDVFFATFQHKVCGLGSVDVLKKTRKKTVCSFKLPPFALLIVHSKASGVYLTLQDVTDACCTDDAVTNDITKLIDDVIKDCCERLSIRCTNEPRNAWYRPADAPTNENLDFLESPDEDDDLEKALKTNARLTDEVKFLKSKTENLTGRVKNLLHQLFELEARAFLWQHHFIHCICSSEDTLKAVENWITKRKDSRQAGAEAAGNSEESTQPEGFNLVECLTSMTNDELAEMLVEIQRPDLLVVLTNEQSKGTSFQEDPKGAVGQRYDDVAESRNSSDRPSWCFPPSPVGSREILTVNNDDEVIHSPILREEYTQTDSLSFVYENKDVQTDPAQPTDKETLEIGMADFERDRAQRQLRKSRISHEILAFQDCSRSASPGSIRDSIISETSSQDKEGLSIDIVPMASNATYRSWIELPLKNALFIETSSQGGESDASETTPRNAISSGFLHEDLPSKDSTDIETSSQGGKSDASETTPRNAISSGFLHEDLPSKDSIDIETSSQEREGAFSETAPRDSISSVFLHEVLPSQIPIVIETSNQDDEGVASKGIPLLYKSSSGFSLEQLQSQQRVVNRTSSQEGEGSSQNSISSGFLSRQDIETTETESSPNVSESSQEESSSGIGSINSIRQCDRVATDRENGNAIIHLPMHDNNSCREFELESGDEVVEKVYATKGNVLSNKLESCHNADENVDRAQRDESLNCLSMQGNLICQEKDSSLNKNPEANDVNQEEHLDETDGRDVEAQNRSFTFAELSFYEYVASTSYIQKQGNAKTNFPLMRTLNEQQARKNGLPESHANSHEKSSGVCRSSVEQNSSCGNRDEGITPQVFESWKSHATNKTSNGSLKTPEVRCSSRSFYAKEYLGNVECNYDDEVRDGGKPSKQRTRSSQKCSYRPRTEFVESDGDVSGLQGVALGKRESVGKGTLSASVTSSKPACDDVTSSRVVGNGVQRTNDVTWRKGVCDGVKSTSIAAESVLQSASTSRIPVCDGVTLNKVVCYGAQSTHDVTCRKVMRDGAKSTLITAESVMESASTSRKPVFDDFTFNQVVHNGAQSTNDVTCRKVVCDGVEISQTDFEKVEAHDKQRDICYLENSSEYEYPLHGVGNNDVTERRSFSPVCETDDSEAPIVFGVQSSFLSKHTNDFCLTRSFSLQAGENHRGFLSLPVSRKTPSSSSMVRRSLTDDENHLTPLSNQCDLLSSNCDKNEDLAGSVCIEEDGFPNEHIRTRLPDEFRVNKTFAVENESNLDHSFSKKSTSGLNIPNVNKNVYYNLNLTEERRVQEQAGQMEVEKTASHSSVSSDSYATADSSIQSLEDEVATSKMTWSQMSGSVFLDQEQQQQQHPQLEQQAENNEETERRSLLTASNGQNMQRNREKEKKLVASDFNKAEGLRETIKNVEDYAAMEQVKNQSAAGQAAISVSAQRLPADACKARELEVQKAKARQREEQRRKEKEEIDKHLEIKQVQSPPSSPQPVRLPVQEVVEWPCDHYKRKCEVKFPCCEQFYFCHRCHNNSGQCQKEDNKALNATHLRCLVCRHEQEITNDSHHCRNCNTQLSEYFCGICKHFTGNEKTPYHCEPCGICRIHRDRSFHCDVCNVCLDNRLRDRHKCRPDSGHDECCICLEDAFSGCQILPCSHKVHRDCAVAMIKNGVRKCPVCRSPLNVSQR